MKQKEHCPVSEGEGQVSEECFFFLLFVLLVITMLNKNTSFLLGVVVLCCWLGLCHANSPRGPTFQSDFISNVLHINSEFLFFLFFILFLYYLFFFFHAFPYRSLLLLFPLHKKEKIFRKLANILTLGG